MTLPAYPIVPTADQLALIGEISVIIGQADEDMIRTVQRLIQVDRKTAQVVMGSTNVKPRAETWASLIRARCKDPQILQYVDFACKEIADVASDRNHFIHSDWINEFRFPTTRADGTPAGHFTMFARHPVYVGNPNGGKAVAVKVQNSNVRKSAAELEPLRDRAATLSCVIAHISHFFEVREKYGYLPSPWQDRLPELPPPPSDKGTRPRKATKQKPPHES